MYSTSKLRKVWHILKVESFLSSYEDTTSFTTIRLECNTFLLFGPPINATIVDESNEIVARSLGTIAHCVITVDSNNKTVYEMILSYLGWPKLMRRVW